MSFFRSPRHFPYRYHGHHHKTHWQLQACEETQAVAQGRISFSQAADLNPHERYNKPIAMTAGDVHLEKFSSDPLSSGSTSSGRS